MNVEFQPKYFCHGCKMRVDERYVKFVKVGVAAERRCPVCNSTLAFGGIFSTENHGTTQTADRHLGE